MSSNQDYYELLGVPGNASAEEIKQAYRKLARRLHPDVNPGDPEAAERFKAINEAYEVLRDPEKRSLYDRFGPDALRGPGAGPGGAGVDFGGFGDIFEAFFGSGMRSGGPAGPERGDDLRLDLDISLEEAAAGVEKTVRLSHLAACEKCSGTGAEGGARPETCPSCRGTGQVRRQQNTILGSFATVTTCGVCHGEGAVVRNPCGNCRGEGRLRSSEEITINIPPGVDTGARMRLAGKGNVGRRGGPAGDYYVVIHVRAHPRLRRQGDDLLTEVPVGIAQAALGAKVHVNGIWGDVEVDVPPGVQPGETFTVRREGMPALNGGGRGDLHVTVRLVVPEDLTAEQKELLRKFAELRGEEHDLEQTFFERLKERFTGR